MNRINEMKFLLKEFKIEEFYILLDIYLKDIKKLEYKYLLINLLEICLLEKEYEFRMLFDEIEVLKDRDYYLDSYLYIREFYYCIENNKLEEAEFYFKIISNYSNNDNIIEELNSTLIKEKYKSLITKIIKHMKDTNEVIHVLNNVSNYDKELIFLIIGDKKYNNIKVSSLGNVLLFRFINLRQNIDYVEEINNIVTLYNNKEYDLCIEKSNELFKDSNFNIEIIPNSRDLFVVLAKSYYKSKSRQQMTVRKYLNIAMYLNRYVFSYDEKYDYSEWIEKLSYSIKIYKSRRRSRIKQKNYNKST